ncbi:MAG: hypothetical protein JNJ77_14300 [Planctomycetia bacterium]|nr:hypothetical protein [Planctomycetia bacterium]
MLAVAGAILINAACVLAATTKDTADIYLGQRLIAGVGAVLIVVDLYPRLMDFIRQSKGTGKSNAKPPL